MMLDAVRRRTEILLSLRRSPSPPGLASLWGAGASPRRRGRASKRDRHEVGENPRAENV
jgi:hypothetical protein